MVFPILSEFEKMALGMVAAKRVDIRKINEPTRRKFIDLGMMEPPLVDMDGPWIFITEEGQRIHNQQFGSKE